MKLKKYSLFRTIALSLMSLPISSLLYAQARYGDGPINLTQVVYTAVDSLEVVQLLREDCGDEATLYYAKKFIGRPYVAHTLEISDEEKLVVNLRQLDCTTLVETVYALVLTKRQPSASFADFCCNLEKIRYWEGKRDGYVSRLHYFDWWICDNIKKGVVEEVCDTSLFHGRKEINNKYMSNNPHRYKYLQRHPDAVHLLSEKENRFNGRVVKYMKEESTGLGSDVLSFIKNGDIIAIVTAKKGLDYSHLGFAVWGNDGKLHLLNASSIYKRVVVDKNSLVAYLKKLKSSVGICLFRLR